MSLALASRLDAVVAAAASSSSDEDARDWASHPFSRPLATAIRDAVDKSSRISLYARSEGPSGLTSWERGYLAALNDLGNVLDKRAARFSP